VRQVIIITGDPVDGFSYIGPFEDYDAAVFYTDTVFDRYDTWWIADLWSAADLEDAT
jgi:hypothetical protein